MSWTSRDDYYHKQWTYSWQLNVNCWYSMKVPNAICLSPTRYSGWQAELKPVANIIMNVSDCARCCQMPLLLIILLLGTTRTHRIYSMTIAMITDWKCRDQVTDQELFAHNAIKHKTVAPTVWVSSLIMTIELVTLTWFCFSQNLSWLCQWHFAKLITVKKRSWQSDWPSDGC